MYTHDNIYTTLARWIVVVVCCFRFYAQYDAESIASPKDGRPIRGSSNGNQFNGSPRHAPSRNRHPQYRFRPPLMSLPLPTPALPKREIYQRSNDRCANTTLNRLAKRGEKKQSTSWWMNWTTRGRDQLRTNMYAICSTDSVAVFSRGTNNELTGNISHTCAL